MPDRWGSDWDDDPVGDHDAGTGIRRAWRRGWHQYAAIMLGLLGAFVLIGTVPLGTVSGITAGAALLLASGTVVLADGPKPSLRAPVRRPPTERAERAWYAATLALTVLAVALLVTG